MRMFSFFDKSGANQRHMRATCDVFLFRKALQKTFSTGWFVSCDKPTCCECAESQQNDSCEAADQSHAQQARKCAWRSAHISELVVFHLTTRNVRWVTPVDSVSLVVGSGDKTIQ